MPTKPVTPSPAAQLRDALANAGKPVPVSEPDDRHSYADLQALIKAIYLKYSYDFRDYAGASQKRRVLKALEHLGYPTIPALQAAVVKDAELFMRLLQFLTIPVSDMFRDPSFFLALREQVVPVLRTYPSLKIWIAGCSTGEEVYSLAILLKEEGLLDRSMIYATDINPTSLAKARQGIFSTASIQGHTANYQAAGGKQAFSDHYTAAYDGAIFEKSLRNNVTFADHSLATDSVFSETQLILCRNVLIYFNRKLQNRALGLFHESLSHRGFLGLGSKESIDFSAHAAHFEALDQPERIFRKVEASAR
ncbi:MAG TPA: protein-glutamate O-methyltransferase CheR [Polaromonas sp.]|uniref:CheR family methyltransferase n=1 Tax=Polaromonas sp. TaxID=1869339 RepID=UPI002D696EFB|nr:protein-glutamate O-methyltransferase CheR [Polaromonas sp.]HYW58094.1 protein-glutamate O-methyltransferase CheR [Polaromonas sp.]